MTQQQTPALQTPAIHVHGAWHGAVGDPKRLFKGHVTESAHPDFPVGVPVEVTYTTHEQRQPHAAEHGTYELKNARQKVQLMSFTCHAVGSAGHKGIDDTLPADWQAVAISDNCASS